MPDVTENDVWNVIAQLKNSSAGWDHFPAIVAKQCINGYITPLTHVINLSLIQGVFPSELKLARVVPIYKNGDRQQITNYRPISVTSFFSKVFEKIMCNVLTNFLEENGVISKFQFGFRKKHGTQHAIITLVDKVSKSVDSGDIVINMFIDLRKAFDTVSHSILLKKLHAYGIRGNMLKLCTSYLDGRSQYVQYNHANSAFRNVNCGVPQGSIIGPLFFIIFMNDIFYASELLFNVLYADDTSIFLSHKDLQTLVQSMNNEMKHISQWLKANKLTLNSEKTYYMVFHRGRRKSYNNIKLYIDDAIIEEASTIKYLGVILDNKLKWTSHIAFVKNKVAKGIGIIQRASKFLTKATLSKLYYTFIFPYLIYCVEVWGCAKSVHLSPLKLIQKKIVRVITFSDRLAHTAPLFKQLNILPLDKLIFHRIGLFMYKIHHNMHPSVINEMYVQNHNIYDYNTRQKFQLHVSKGQIDLYAKGFYCSSILIWNEITKCVNTVAPCFQFKILLKQYLQDNDLKLGF